MTDGLRALTRDQSFLAAIVARLDQQNAVLAEIRDRLPAPSEGQPDADQAGDNGTPQEVELTEPAAPAQGETGPLAEPAQPAKRPPAKKPAAKTTAARSPRGVVKKGT